MATKEEEDEQLRSVALLNTQSIHTARRRAEEALRKQSEWLRVTLSSIADGVISTDAEARVTFMNAVAESLTGWALAESVGRLLTDVFQIVSERSRQPVENPAVRALKEGAIVGLANHTVLIAKDGTELAIDDSAAPIRNEQGEIVGAVLVFRDITKRRDAENALSRSESDLADFFENASVGLRWIGPDGTILRVNQTELDLLGYDREEYVGRHISEFHVDESAVKEIFDRLALGETVNEYPARLRHKDGSLRNVVVSSNALFENGKFIHTRTFTRDVTDQKRAEGLLRQGEERLRFIMDSMPQKVFTANSSGDVDYLNPQWNEFTGVPYEQLMGWGWTQILHPDDMEKTASTWRRSIASGEKFHFEHRFRRRDGDYRWHFTRSMPFRDNQNKITMWVGSTTDVHEQKETSNRLRKLAADLSEADRHKNEFLAMLAHELRNPLAPISNALQIVQHSTGNGAALKSASAMMERQVAQLVRLVDDLLDVSRISQGKIELRRERVAVASIIHHALETSRPAIEFAEHELKVILPDEPVYLYADSARLAQAFSNLLNNACKYTEPHGRISVSAELDGAQVVVSVKDSGVGIPQHMLGNIFEIFAQLDQSLERSQGGLGIGLTLVKKLVELHDGSVEVHSEGLGQGSEFVVRLPVISETFEPTAPTATLNAPGPVSLRILVVDDNRDSAESLTMLLQIFGHETYTAHDGAAAVDAAEKFRPDVILLDIGLPKLNGYEAARKIRQEPWGKDIVLIALTGWGQSEDRQRSSDAGFNQHMVKPLDHDTLIKLLAEIRPAGDVDSK